MLSDSMYMIAGITDTNSDPSKPIKGFDNFFSDREHFKSVEIGWTSSHERIIFDNTHITFWHKGRQVAANIPDGWGFAFSYSRYLNDNFMPFVRGGYADDGGSLLQKSLSAGVGLNWGEPNRKYILSGPERPARTRVVLSVPVTGSHRNHSGHAADQGPCPQSGGEHDLDV